MIRQALCFAFLGSVAPASAQQAAPDPHTRIVAIFETVCLRGAADFSDSNLGFFGAGLEQKEAGYWVDPQLEIIGGARASEGDAQFLCSVGLVGGDPVQLAEILPNMLPAIWDHAEMRRFEGSDGRSDIFMIEGDDGIRAAWVDTSEGNIAVLMTSYTRKEVTAQ